MIVRLMVGARELARVNVVDARCGPEFQEPGDLIHGQVGNALETWLGTLGWVKPLKELGS